MIRILTDPESYPALARSLAPLPTQWVAWPPARRTPPWLLADQLPPQIADLRSGDPLRTVRLLDDLGHTAPLRTVLLVGSDDRLPVTLATQSGLAVTIRAPAPRIDWPTTLAMRPQGGPLLIGLVPPSPPAPRRPILPRLIAALAHATTMDAAADLCQISRGSLVRLLRFLRTDWHLPNQRMLPDQWSRALIAALRSQATGTTAPLA